MVTLRVGRFGGRPAGLGLNPDSDASWLCHIGQVAFPFRAGVSCLDNGGGVPYLGEKLVRSPMYSVQPRPLININFLPSVARTKARAGGGWG